MRLGWPKISLALLKPGRHHPQEREDERDRHDHERDRPADLLHEAKLALRQRHQVSLRRKASCTTVSAMTIDEHDHRQRRGIADVEELEALLVDVEGEHQRAVLRAAAGHQVDVVEDLERADHGDDHDDQRGRAEQRPDDHAEDLPARRAFEPRRRLVVARDRLQRGDVEDHVQPDHLDDAGDDDRRHRPVRLAQPVGPVDADMAPASG